jgi:hypothetical protein
MITLIGFRCNRSNALSREVLIDRCFKILHVSAGDLSRREGEELENRNNLLFV